MSGEKIPDNSTPAEITEIMPKSFRLGDSNLTRETVWGQKWLNFSIMNMQKKFSVMIEKKYL